MGRLEHELIRTERLDLILLPVPALLAYEERIAADIDPLVDLPCTNPFAVLKADPGPLRHRIPQVREDPEVNPWLVHVITESSSGAAVGLINFHDAPDDYGMVEIGYRIVPERRRRGYAREATIGMFRWATADPRTRTFRASVSPDNTASRNLILGLGMVEVGMQEDEDDGPEVIYEISANDFLERQAR